MQAHIISTGDEVITGFINDTNASYLSYELLNLGIQVKKRITVGDKLEDICAALLESSKECELIIVTGGLGPTSDDNTAKACAKAMGVELKLSEMWHDRLEQWCIERSRELNENNLKQAYLPDGSFLIDNKCGTACGFYVYLNKAICFFAPGVPFEMVNMYKDGIEPIIKQKLNINENTKVKRLFLFGISEARLGRMLDEQSFDKNIVIGYRAYYPILELKIISHDAPKAEIEKCYEKIMHIVEKYYLCEDEFTLAGQVRKMLQDKTISVFDNATSGTFCATYHNDLYFNTALIQEGMFSENCLDFLKTTNTDFFIGIIKKGEGVHIIFNDHKNDQKFEYSLEINVPIKDKKSQALSLLVLTILHQNLKGKITICPDECTITKL